MATLLTLAATIAMSFGATAAHATLINDTIYGCAARALSGSTLVAQAQKCATGTGTFADLFTQNPTAGVVVDSGGVPVTEFSGSKGNLLVSADFSASSFKITFKNSGTGSLAVPAGGGLIFSSLEFP